SGMENIQHAKVLSNSNGSGILTLSNTQLAVIHSLKISAENVPSEKLDKEDDSDVSHSNLPFDRSHMIASLKKALDVSSTPQRYQVLANMLYYDAGIDLSGITVERDGKQEPIIDNSKYYGRYIRMVGSFMEDIPA